MNTKKAARVPPLIIDMIIEMESFLEIIKPSPVGEGGARSATERASSL